MCVCVREREREREREIVCVCVCAIFVCVCVCACVCVCVRGPVLLGKRYTAHTGTHAHTRLIYSITHVDARTHAHTGRQDQPRAGV